MTSGDITFTATSHAPPTKLIANASTAIMKLPPHDVVQWLLVDQEIATLHKAMPITWPTQDLVEQKFGTPEQRLRITRSTREVVPDDVLVAYGQVTIHLSSMTVFREMFDEWKGNFPKTRDYLLRSHAVDESSDIFGIRVTHENLFAAAALLGDVVSAVVPNTNIDAVVRRAVKLPARPLIEEQFVVTVGDYIVQTGHNSLQLVKEVLYDVLTQ